MRTQSGKEIVAKVDTHDDFQHFYLKRKLSFFIVQGHGESLGVGFKNY
jgi:hypothetical protein